MMNLIFLTDQFNLSINFKSHHSYVVPCGKLNLVALCVCVCVCVCVRVFVCVCVCVFACECL